MDGILDKLIGRKMLFNKMIMLKSLLEQQKIMVKLVIFKKFIRAIKGGPLGAPGVILPPPKDPKRKWIYFWTLMFMGLVYTIYQRIFPDQDNENKKEDRSGILNLLIKY